MNEQQRRKLVEKPHDFYKFRGRRATVAGWAARCNATVTTSAPGFFHATWKEIQRAADSDGVIKNAIWVGGGWLGCESPEGEEAQVTQLTDELGATLRKARRVRHLTLLNLNHTTGVSVAYMSDVERGKDPLEALKNWAAALGYRVIVELEAVK